MVIGTKFKLFESQWFRALQRHRYPASAVLDSLFWFVALTAAVLARLDFNPSSIEWRDLFLVAVFLASVQILVGVTNGLYRGRRPLGSFSEVRLVAWTALLTTLAGLSLVLGAGTPHLVPTSTVISGGAYQVLGALGLRYSLRWLVERASRSHHARPHRLIVFGAGEAGEQIIRALNRDPHTDLDPVALLDDDPTRQRLILDGVRVAGDRRDIERVARDYEADTLLLAMPSAGQEPINEIVLLAQSAGLQVKVLPSIHTLARANVTIRDIRDIQFTNFLNRDEVQIDDDAVFDYVQGKTVLVTGAGGSIGSVLCRTLAKYDPSELIMVDHDENALHALTLPHLGDDGLNPDGLALCDVRDTDSLHAVFAAAQPDVVFHAAAHKHVTFLEKFPDEGYKTNVAGTLNVLTAASSVGVGRFVNISTDKAAEPINVLGTTKRLAERLTSHFNDQATGTYSSVRFGNVLGSNGSVIPTFVNQLRNGQRLTVTDPEATRYFMTTEEAVLLVLQAGALGVGGDVLVLDMGDPVGIDELARRLAREVAPTQLTTVAYIGLRKGEKLHETLVATDDAPAGQPHERLFRFVVPPLDPDEMPPVNELTSTTREVHSSGTI